MPVSQFALLVVMAKTVHTAVHVQVKIMFVLQKRVNAAVDLDGRGQNVTKNATPVHGVLTAFIAVNVKPVIQQRVTADHVHRAILVPDVVNHVQINGGGINVTKCVRQVLCLQKVVRLGRYQNLFAETAKNVKIFRVDDMVGVMRDSACVHLVTEEVDAMSVADLVHGDKIVKKYAIVVKGEHVMA